MKIYEEEVWVLMDFHKKLIAKGVPRNRYLCLIDGPEKKRILTYSSKGKAQAANEGFFDGKGVRQYIYKVYGFEGFQDPEMYPVKIKLSMETIE